VVVAATTTILCCSKKKITLFSQILLTFSGICDRILIEFIKLRRTSMNYEKIIVELLGRIQVLEEQVAMLMQEKNQASEQEANKITTDDIRQYILELKKAAKDAGKSFIILKSGDIHKELNLKSRMPQVCNAMRQSMNEGDIVLHTTPSGNSSTIEIQYNV
jgi:hypothetical protein